MTVSKIMDFKENDLFQENEQILSNFKESLVPFSVFLSNITDFKEIDYFSSNYQISIKSKK